MTDLDRAVRFHEAMGLRRHQGITEGVAFFQLGGLILALWPRAALEADSGRSVGEPRTSPTALAYNTRSEAEVDAVLARAKQAGGAIVKPAQRAFWGGWCGYFEDSEGFLWEVAHNPDFPIAADGTVSLPA